MPARTVLLFRDNDNGEFEHSVGDEGRIRVRNEVFDPNLLAWVRMKQPTVEVGGDLNITMGDVERILAGNYWKDQRFDYEGNNVVYKGLNVTHKAGTDSSTWYVWRYTWVGNNCTRIEGPLMGTWNGRADLGWA